MGKGSSRRPAAVKQEEWAERWARTFSATRDSQLWPAPATRAPEHDEEQGEEDGREV